MIWLSLHSVYIDSVPVVPVLTSSPPANFSHPCSCTRFPSNRRNISQSALPLSAHPSHTHPSHTHTHTSDTVPRSRIFITPYDCRRSPLRCPVPFAPARRRTCTSVGAGEHATHDLSNADPTVGRDAHLLLLHGVEGLRELWVFDKLQRSCLMRGQSSVRRTGAAKGGKRSVRPPVVWRRGKAESITLNAHPGVAAAAAPIALPGRTVFWSPCVALVSVHPKERCGLVAVRPA